MRQKAVEKMAAVTTDKPLTLSRAECDRIVGDLLGVWNGLCLMGEAHEEVTGLAMLLADVTDKLMRDLNSAALGQRTEAA